MRSPAARASARVSVTPGRTRELNFFTLGKDEALYWSTCPATATRRPRRRKSRAGPSLIRDYLRGRRELKRVFLLIDARHGLKDNDRETMTLMDEAAISYQAVLTKADKPKAAELGRDHRAGQQPSSPSALQPIRR